MKPKQFLFFLLACVFTASSSFAQQGTVEVTGLVKDKTGMLISGANVTEKGTKTLATTASGLSRSV
jgi:hypothetical protein